MPHHCAGCGREYTDARVLKEGCPECGGRKFIFRASHERRKKNVDDSSSDSSPSGINDKKNIEDGAEEKNQGKGPCPDSIESISILEPGRYDLNLAKLAESDDLVVRVRKDDTYRLDLHSMVRKKKKE